MHLPRWNFAVIQFFWKPNFAVRVSSKRDLLERAQFRPVQHLQAPAARILCLAPRNVRVHDPICQLIEPLVKRQVGGFFLIVFIGPNNHSVEKITTAVNRSANLQGQIGYTQTTLDVRPQWLEVRCDLVQELFFVLLGRQPSKFCFIFLQSFSSLSSRNPKVRFGFLFFAQMGPPAKANTVQTRHRDSNIATALLARPKQSRDGRWRAHAWSHGDSEINHNKGSRRRFDMSASAPTASQS